MEQEYIVRVRGTHGDAHRAARAYGFRFNFDRSRRTLSGTFETVGRVIDRDQPDVGPEASERIEAWLTDTHGAPTSAACDRVGTLLAYRIA